MLLQKNLDRLVSIYIFVVIMFFKKSFDYLVVTDRLFGSIVVEKNLRFRLDFVNIPELSIDSIQNIAEAGVSHWLDHNYRRSQISYRIIHVDVQFTVIYLTVYRDKVM